MALVDLTQFVIYFLVNEFKLLVKYISFGLLHTNPSQTASIRQHLILFNI